jgi:hypothetical protein
MRAPCFTKLILTMQQIKRRGKDAKPRKKRIAPQGVGRPKLPPILRNVTVSVSIPAQLYALLGDSTEPQIKAALLERIATGEKQPDTKPNKIIYHGRKRFVLPIRRLQFEAIFGSNTAVRAWLEDWINETLAL